MSFNCELSWQRRSFTFAPGDRLTTAQNEHKTDLVSRDGLVCLANIAS